MSIVSEFLKDQRLDRQERIKRREIKQMILNNCRNDDPQDRSINRYFHMRNDIVKQICSDNYWEETREGFETRTDFAFDYDNVEIVFVRHQIIKQGDQYTTNGSELAERHLQENEERLASLNKLDRIIYSYYEQYKEGIDEGLKQVRTLDERTINGSVNFDLNDTNRYILRYGKIGLNLLIKWLNKLNDPHRSLEELLEEFLKDINDAKVYYESVQDHSYLEAVNSGRIFEKEMLRIMDLYSPRASKLYSLYLTKIRHEKGIKRQSSQL